MSEHFPPTGDPSELNALAALIESASRDGFMPFTERYGAASAVLNSDWLRRKLEAVWDAGYVTGDPHQRRGDPALAPNPYRDETDPIERLREHFAKGVDHD